MKDTPLKPWSLPEADLEDPRCADSADGHETDASSSRPVSADTGLAEFAKRWNVQSNWAAPMTAMACAWACAALMCNPASSAIHFAGIFLLSAGAAAVHLMTRSPRSVPIRPEAVSQLEHQTSNAGGTGINGDLRPIWRSVEQHAENIQRRLKEVLEEHARISLELSLATAQKRQAAAIIDSIADPILVVDSFDQLIMINAAAAELLGLDRSQALRKPIGDAITDTKLVGILRQAREADCRAAKRRAEHEIKSRAFALTTSPIASDPSTTPADGARHGVVAVLRDVTKDRETARAKSEFVAQAAHELRTPLSAIRAYVEMLVDGEASDEKTRAEYYETIQLSANRLGRMIDNILNISRIEAGTVRVNKEPVAISLIVKEAADTMRPQAEKKKITLTEDLAPVVDRIRADRDLIQQAILNLLSNAIKYTPEGGQVRIRMITRQDERTIRIEVSDSGAGVPKEDLSRVFDKFFRVESNKQIAPGTGLGLSLVKQVVETVHGGEISLSSEVGVGSTFAMTLPLYEGRIDSDQGDTCDVRKTRIGL